MESKRILVVEDEMIIAIDITWTLESLGYIVVGSASNGEQSVALATQLNPDFMLMDINLGNGMTGIDAYRQIRVTADIPVIFLTGYHSEQVVREQLGAGVAYLAKPFEPGELEAALERVAEGARSSKA